MPTSIANTWTSREHSILSITPGIEQIPGGNDQTTYRTKFQEIGQRCDETTSRKGLSGINSISVLPLSIPAVIFASTRSRVLSGGQLSSRKGGKELRVQFQSSTGHCEGTGLCMSMRQRSQVE